jgi:hypothetical protein
MVTDSQRVRRLTQWFGVQMSLIIGRHMLRGYSLSEQAHVSALVLSRLEQMGLHGAWSRLAGVSMTSMFSGLEDQSLVTKFSAGA